MRSLRRTLREAARHTSYYRDLFFEIGFDVDSDFSFDDFSRLPVLDRSDILNHSSAMASDLVPVEQRLADASGGSTGKPVEIWLGPEERGWSESGMQHSFEKIGVTDAARKAFFWGHHLDPKAADTLPERFRSFAMNERFFDCFRMAPDVLSNFHGQLEKYQPDCVIAYASSLAHFAEYLNDRSVRPKNYPRRSFVTGAEKLYQRQRDEIEKAFKGVQIHERYGGRDYGLLGIQIDPSQSYDLDLDWSWALVEPETTDRHTSILVTKLHADAMPMIRYRVGDIGVFPDDSRPGHPTFKLKEVTGRELDRIWLGAERWIAGEEIPHLLKNFPIREFMLVQDEDYSIELQLIPRAEMRETDSQEILRLLRSNLDELPVSLNFVGSIERTRANKWRPVVTRVSH